MSVVVLGVTIGLLSGSIQLQDGLSKPLVYGCLMGLLATYVARVYVYVLLLHTDYYGTVYIC